MDSHQLLARLLDQAPLEDAESSELMRHMLDETIPEAVKGAALALLKVRSISGNELAAFARFLQEQAETLPVDSESMLDTCGTGGGIPSFNISTSAAIIAASAGAKVAKHGNRAITSKCGSADVLEYLGVRVQSSPAIAKRFLDEAGIAFLFAPNHHPTMKHVGAVRKQLGFRTVFNQLGPLANPLRAKRQLLGVYERSMTGPMAEALASLGSSKAAVVHSLDGLDEVSPCQPTQVAWVELGKVRSQVLDLSNFGLEPIPNEGIQPGDSIQSAAEILIESLSDAGSIRFRAVLPSAAMAIYLADLAPDLPSAVSFATEQVKSGQAILKLQDMKRVSKDVDGL